MIGRLARALRGPEPEPDTRGGLPWSDLYPAGRGARGIALPSYAPERSVAITTTPTLLAPANPARRTLTIVCDGATTLYIGQGSPPSSSAYAIALGQGQTYVTGEPGTYRGDVWGVGSVAAGFARIAEAT